MADTTPISNNLNVRLANLLDDAVSGADNGIKAAANGGARIFSADQRNNVFLFNAYAELVHRLVSKYGVKDTGERCEGIIGTQAITFSGTGVALNKDFMYPVDLFNSSLAVFVLVPSRSELAMDLNPYIDQAYALDGGKLYAYQRSSGTLTVLSSGAGTFFYLKADRRNTSDGTAIAVNTTPDTTIDPQYHEFILKYAAYEACLFKGTPKYIEKSKELLAELEGAI